MNSLTGQYGFDERIFISEIPDYFHCTICSLVLRDPIQILRCGHKMCAVCFDQIKTHSHTNSTELLCPIDRNLVDLAGVCEDIYLKRVIGNLVVHCYQQDQGCEWTGDLRELCNHVVHCSYKTPQQQSGDTELLRVRDLTDRVEQCEKLLLVKDKEMAVLNHQVKEQQQLNVALKLHQQQKYESFERQISQLVQKNVELERRQQQQQQQHEELQQQQQQHRELKLQLQQKIDDIQGANERQQIEINKLLSVVETLQKDEGIAPCANEDQKIPSTSQVLPGGDFFTVVQKKQPIVIQKKNIFVNFHGGDRTDVTFRDNEHCVQFRGVVTVSARCAVAPPGSKVWYEVKCTRTKQETLPRVGWATSRLKKGGWRNWIGGNADSYAFSVFDGCKEHRGEATEWGIKVSRLSVFVGVALDLMKREILFSVDGHWTGPMGAAFCGIPADIQLFPAFTGTLSTSLEYNFGDHDFTFGPPDGTFRKLIDAIA